MSTDYIDEFVDRVDVIQVGARNMQNFDLLKQLGKTNKPILLKRGIAATIEEWLMSAEYIMAGGNENVILCERGIRTYENYTRNTLDLSAIPVAKASIVAGCDGLMIEVHNNPQCALSDGQQSIKPAAFDELMKKVKVIAEMEGKKLR